MVITVVGVGRVGSETAFLLALRNLDEILMIDVVPNLPQGHALDMGHALSTLGIDAKIRGTNDYSEMQGSDLVIVTAGFPRQPGMTREELVGKNAGLIVDVADKIKKYAPDSIVIVVTNPLDAMAYLMYKKLGFPRERVIGFSGVLDSSRLRYYAAQKLNISPSSINAIVIGQHGEKMLPLPRLSTVGGRPLTELLSASDVSEIVKNTVEAGAVITKLRGFSSNYAPAAGLLLMAESIKRDLKRLFLASVYLNGEYGLYDIMVNVPVILGRNGVERIIELQLNDDEKRAFLESVEAIRANIAQIPKELL